MTYRAIILVPEGLTFEQLTEEQQAACNSVFGQYVNPMPNTIPYNGKQVLDGLAADNFDPTAIGALGLPFEIIGLYHTEAETPIVQLDEAVFINHLPDVVVYDDNGDVVSSTPPTFHIPHSWSGWNTL